MKKTFRKLMLLGALCVSGLSLTACGDDKIHVTFWHTMGQNLQGVLDRYIKEFKKENPGIEIDHAAQGGYDDIKEKLSAAIPAGTTPTMAYCYPDHVAEYMQSSAILDVSNFVEGKSLAGEERPDLAFTTEDGPVSDMIEMYWQEGQAYSQKGIFSVPYAKSTELAFYNKTIFEDTAHHKSGQPYHVPTTWEELETWMAEAKGDYPDMIPLGYDSDANLFITLCEQYGIPYTHIDSASGNGVADFNNAAAKAMVSKLVDWYQKGYITTQGTSNGAYTSTQFTEGTLIMTVGSTGGTTYNFTENFKIGTTQVFKPSEDDSVRFNFGGSLNTHNDHIIMQGPSICFFKKGTVEEKEAAWKFYKFITRALCSAQWSVASGYSPVRDSSFTCDAMVEYLADTHKTGSDALVQNTVKLYSELTSRYYVSPAFHGSSTARDQVNGIFANVAMGTKTLDDAFAEAFAKTTFAING